MATYMHHKRARLIPRKPSPEMALKLMDRHLDLSGEQEEKILVVLKKYHPEVEVIHDQARQNMKTIFDKMFKDFQPILTDEQEQKLQEIFQRLKEHGPAELHRQM